ncbi:MAG: ribonuclease E/G [Rhodospirillales bacterium]|nr:ribonuclease E/G [Rhodospirillales bacterium]
MAVDEIFIAAAAGRALAGFFEAGFLARLEFAAQATDRRLGEVVLGRVARVDAGLGAVFVDIGDGLSGFLNRSDDRSGRCPSGDGDSVLVQISREAEAAEKSAKLTSAVVLPGRALIYCPGRPGIRVSRRIIDDGLRKRLLEVGRDLPAAGGGWFLRHGVAAADPAVIAAEAPTLLDTWQRIEELARSAPAPVRLWRPPDPVLAAVADEAGPALKRVVVDDPAMLAALRTRFPDLAFDLHLAVGAEAADALQAIEAGIDAALAPDVALAAGGFIRIAETPALVAIDVDAGSHRLGGDAATALAVNLQAAEAMVREIRRRELSGHIVADFIAMRPRQSRVKLLDALRAAFAGDRLETHVAGYTPLGKVELSRRRVRPSLRARLSSACPACAGSGFMLAPEAVARRALRAALHELSCPVGAASLVAAPPVAAFLRGPAAEALAAVEARLGRRIAVREDPQVPAGAARFEIQAKATGRG